MHLITLMSFRKVPKRSNSFQKDVSRSCIYLQYITRRNIICFRKQMFIAKCYINTKSVITTINFDNS